MMYSCAALHHYKLHYIQPAKDTDTIETEFLVDLVSSRCRVNAFSSLTYKQQYPFIPFKRTQYIETEFRFVKRLLELFS